MRRKALTDAIIDQQCWMTILMYLNARDVARLLRVSRGDQAFIKGLLTENSKYKMSTEARSFSSRNREARRNSIAYFTILGRILNIVPGGEIDIFALLQERDHNIETALRAAGAGLVSSTGNRLHPVVEERLGFASRRSVTETQLGELALAIPLLAPTVNARVRNNHRLFRVGNCAKIGVPIISFLLGIAMLCVAGILAQSGGGDNKNNMVVTFFGIGIGAALLGCLSGCIIYCCVKKKLRENGSEMYESLIDRRDRRR